MFIREAIVSDIPVLHSIRLSVRENVLHTPALVTENDYKDHLENIGKGWVCEADGDATGFAIINCRDSSVWALFIRPEFEGKGLGRRLQEIMLRYYFGIYSRPVWLTTQKGTRAEKFYLNSGWVKLGTTSEGEIKFQMTVENWQKQQRSTD